MAADTTREIRDSYKEDCTLSESDEREGLAVLAQHSTHTSAERSCSDPAVSGPDLVPRADGR